VAGDVVVLVDAGLVLPTGWLDGLLRAFDDPNVAMVGPVFNAGNPAQRSELPVSPATSASDLAPEVAAWAEEHRSLHHRAYRIEPWCLAVRVDLLQQVEIGDADPFDPETVDRLCHELVVRGFDVMVAEEVYVLRADADLSEPSMDDEIRHLHAVSHARRSGPLLSAALIVKNEEENLPRCLASLSGLVDEVVVYDTGSTDATVAIARDAGATVVEGYWDDDFSRARNEAISHCRGEWILSIDADEIATGDAAAVRVALEVNWYADVLVVQITNLLGKGDTARAGLDHHGPRLLRRSRCRWRLRLHEQPCTPSGEPPMRGGRLSHVRLLHTGYTDDAAGARDKIARNIRVAEEGMAELVDPDPEELAANLVNLGRSYTWAARSQDALDCYQRVVDLDAPEGYRRAALTHGFEALMALERLEEAEEWLALLREASSEQSLVPRYLDGLLHFRRGDVEGALECLKGVDAIADDDGTLRGADIVSKVLGMAHLANREWAAALDALLLAATAGGVPAWGPLAVAAVNAHADLRVVTTLVSDASLLSACAEIVMSTPALAPTFLELLWERLPGDPRLLGVAARLGPTLTVARALEWSPRLRAAGSTDHCPLRAILESAEAPPAERLRAAAVLETAFDERQPDARLIGLAAALGPDDGETVRDEIALLSPRVGAVLATQPVASGV